MMLMVSLEHDEWFGGVNLNSRGSGIVASGSEPRRVDDRAVPFLIIIMTMLTTAIIDVLCVCIMCMCLHIRIYRIINLLLDWTGDPLCLVVESRSSVSLLVKSSTFSSISNK